MSIHLKNKMRLFVQLPFHLMENTWQVDLLISNFKFFNWSKILQNTKKKKKKKKCLKSNLLDNYELAIVSVLHCIARSTYEIYFFLFRTIKLWNLETNVNVHTFEAHNDCVNTVAFSPNGKYLASGSSDK